MTAKLVDIFSRYRQWASFAWKCHYNINVQCTTIYVYEPTMNFKFTFACQNHHTPTVIGSPANERINDRKRTKQATNFGSLYFCSFIFYFIFCDSIGNECRMGPSNARILHRKRTSIEIAWYQKKGKSYDFVNTYNISFNFLPSIRRLYRVFWNLNSFS